jgi:serine/threonine protein kinase
LAATIVFAQLHLGNPGVQEGDYSDGLLEVLKVVNQTLLSRPGALERFQREIQAVAKLSHPNIVTAYSVLRLGTLMVLAMEYVEGQDLGQGVQKRGPMPVVNACHYVQQAASGLQHAYEKGLVHRDIKPSNLILSRDKKQIVKILDFGLAKATSEKRVEGGLTGEGKMLGTPDYVAPEQTLDAQQADIRADIYSLGCTLYYLLTGAPPFQGNSLYEILQAHHSVDARPLNLVRPEVPVELAAVVAKMMAKDPARRYQQPDEVAKALFPSLKEGAWGLPNKSSPELSHEAVSGTAESCRKPSVPDPSAGRVAPPGVSSPSRRTRVEIDTSHPLVSRSPELQVPGKQREPAPSGASPFEGLTARRPRQQPIEDRSEPEAEDKRQRMRTLAIAVGLGVLVGLMVVAAVILMVRTPQGTIVLEIDQPGAEVSIDRERITVNVPGDNKPVEIEKEPGQHTLRISKDGFVAVTREIELKSGKLPPIKIRLEPIKAQAEREEHLMAPRPVLPTDGFVALFNGKDLTGWKTHPKQPGNWRVENGILIGSGPAVSHLYTEREAFRDFYLRLEARINDKGNSGVYFRAPFGPVLPARNPWLPTGYEAQVNSTHEDVNKTGSLFNHGESSVAISIRESPVTPSQWFTLEVIAEGNHIVVKVNDKTTADYTDEKRRFTSGHIALQQHNPQTVCEFRKIEIKELPLAGQLPATEALDKTPPPPRGNAKPPQPQPDGFVPLFNGKDLTGWSSQVTTLSFADGVLIAQNRGRSRNVDHLVTNRTDYADFHFRCQVMLSDGQNHADVMCRVNASPFAFGGMRGYVFRLRGTEAELSLASCNRGDYQLAKSTLEAQAARDYHNLDIIAIGDRIQVLINGKKVLDYRDKGQTFRRGAVALRLLPGTTSRYRNMEIQELKPALESAPSNDVRTRWVHQASAGRTPNHERWGVFQHAEGKEWIESLGDHPAFQRFRFTEVDRTNEYVELERPDAEGKLVVRLHKTQMEIGRSRNELKNRYTGQWVK